MSSTGSENNSCPNCTGSKRQATPKKVEMAERDTDDNTDPSKAGNTTHDVIIEVDECKGE